MLQGNCYVTNQNPKYTSFSKKAQTHEILLIGNTQTVLNDNGIFVVRIETTSKHIFSGMKHENSQET